ncbi:MAG: protein kinase, partial [Myxococcales bacterium]|nr:protein kinase [Myxococcales bacterium]
PRAAGLLREQAGDAAGAGEDYEAAGALLEAAACFERADDARSAARCLEAALARDARCHRARVELGALLARHGRHQAAVRTLQQVPKDAPERSEALLWLRRSLEALALSEAVRQVDEELAALGIDPTADTRAAPVSERAPAVTPETILFGRYVVLRDVARTPTARVLEARDRITGENVALKIFAASTLKESGRDALRRFEREAVALGKLRHPAIVPLRAFLAEGPAVVLAWMGGGSLADKLAAEPLSPARAVEITQAVLGALSAAHRRGILHRDIKPANVLFDEAGAAYLADFGTAHVSDSAATVTAGIIGTLAYMAPEQRAGEAANIASDIYGAGALLWHALTGAPPGAGLSFLSDELGPEHRSIAERLVAPEAERPADAEAALALLRSASWPRAVPAARATPARPRPEKSHDSVRLEPLGDERFRDVLLGRTVLVLAADDTTMERALAFARADHPNLAAVLALHADEQTLWVEALDATPLSRELSDDERRELFEALAALHRAGGVHGFVGESLVERGGRVMLRFPTRAAPSADANTDVSDLAAFAPPRQNL